MFGDGLLARDPEHNVRICPMCGSEQTFVVDSRCKTYLYRRRRCDKCDYHYSTLEICVDEYNDILGENDIPVEEMHEVIKRERIRRKLTQKQFANRIGYSQQYVHLLEKGTREMTVHMAQAMLKYLGYEVVIRPRKGART